MTHTREVMKLAVSLRMKLRNNGKGQVGGPRIVYYAGLIFRE